ncbi:hypothetical protein KC19_N032500, partial [Ceratodon purpureus]
MEGLCCQSVGTVELCRLRFRRRVGHPSVVSHGRGKNLDERTFPMGGGIGGCVRETYGPSSWRRCVKVGAVRAHNEQSLEGKEGILKVCVRCGMAYRDKDNSPVACKYHGHMTGDQGLHALAPPHQGIDGEWSDASGVIVYKWNDEDERPSTGSKNWKRRWTCCGLYDEDAVPCHLGRHVSYDDGALIVS